MPSQLRGLASRLWNSIPFLSRSINNRATSKSVPPVRDPAVLPQVFRPNYHLESIKSPADFLKAIGRSSETKISVESWEDFWKKGRLSLKKDGVSVRDRRYVLIFENCNGFASLKFCSDIFYGVWKSIA